MQIHANGSSKHEELRKRGAKEAEQEENTNDASVEIRATYKLFQEARSHRVRSEFRSKETS